MRSALFFASGGMNSSRAPGTCHCEPVRRLARQSVSPAPQKTHGLSAVRFRSYFRPPLRDFFSFIFISDSLLSDCCMNCLSRSSKLSGPGAGRT